MTVDIRAVGRGAIRAELGRLAFDLFCQHGFAAVTLDDIAAAGSTSRSTVLRYFGSKEDVVLFALDPLGDGAVGALGDRPADENDWLALRRSLDTAIGAVTSDREDALALFRLVWQTSALRARLAEKQVLWREQLALRLQARVSDDETALRAQARAAAALECLVLAVEHWVNTDGVHPLDELIDEAFDAVTPLSPGAGSPGPQRRQPEV
ncbi:TetR family transcriptional regulator [Streptomyces shenzhenensis]|uniref:TetR/AcrR family transcriptional regulator n=1 Tax=Streptomyces shenzhenensis TaxID=943815 RepID=UPI0033E22B69